VALGSRARGGVVPLRTLACCGGGSAFSSANWGAVQSGGQPGEELVCMCVRAAWEPGGPGREGPCSRPPALSRQARARLPCRGLRPGPAPALTLTAFLPPLSQLLQPPRSRWGRRTGRSVTSTSRSTGSRVSRRLGRAAGAGSALARGRGPSSPTLPGAFLGTGRRSPVTLLHCEKMNVEECDPCAPSRPPRSLAISS
jgi:hypothetical protein